MPHEQNLTEKITEQLVVNGQLPAQCKDQFARGLQQDVERAVLRYRYGLASQVVHQLMIARLAA